MKILTRLYPKDKGDILINGKDAQIIDVASSINHGISMIYDDVSERNVKTTLSRGYSNIGGSIDEKYHAIIQSKDTDCLKIS